MAMKRYASVEDYLSDQSPTVRTTLQKVPAAIIAAAPRDATETISYGMPMFRSNGMLMGYCAFAKHCSLFPGGGVIEQFPEELKQYKTSKGTIQFPQDKPPSA